MPSIYTDFVDQLAPYIDVRDAHRRVAAGPIPVSPTQANALADSPGGRVLAAMAHNNIGEFNTAFGNVFTDGQFRWVGSQGVNNTRVMETLDGDRNSGECAIIAKAFWLLWCAPAPFGLGNPGMSFVSFDHNDATNGFIAPHPPGGIRGLGPNILHPHGGQGDVRNCLYSWGNHKVLLHGGTYYDPAYRTTYAHTNEMVAFEYTDADSQTIGPDQVTQVRVVTPNAARGWGANQLMYLRTPAAMPIGLYGPYRAIAGWE